MARSANQNSTVPKNTSGKRSKKASAAKPNASKKRGSSKPSNAGKNPVTRSTEKPKIISNEIKGIGMIAIGLFLFLAFVTETTGAVGHGIRSLFYGLLGFSSSISCLFVILTGINIFLDRNDSGIIPPAVLLPGIILITSVLVALCSTLTFPPETGFFDGIVFLCRQGIEGHGGGILGGGLAFVFEKLIGRSGAWIFTISAELILGILLTGLSLGALYEKISAFLSHKAKQADPAEDDVDSYYTEPKDPQKAKSGLFGLSLKKKTKQDPVETNEQSPSTKAFFDDYFSGKDPAEGENGASHGGSMPRRFELKEDDALLDQIFANEPSSTIPKEDLPFQLDTMKTGTISEIPATNPDGSLGEAKNPEDDSEFTPPSEAKLEDTVDPWTQKASDAGMPMDRAVVAGQRMAIEDPEPLSQEGEGDAALDEPATPRIIQYHMPTLDLLDPPQPREQSRQEVKYELEEKANRLLDTLSSFRVDAKILNITQGPSVTRFELQPGFGVKVSKITGLADDIALSLAAPGVRIEAPIPGKSAIGIEIPNRHPSPVPIREVLESEKFQSFQSKTAFALGKDIAGSCVVADIAKFPHVLIAGQTGSGKSVCINSLILSILYKANPDEVKLIMVDPKMVELGIYNGIPHLLIPVVTDPKHAAGALNWAVIEMQNRYNLLKDNNVRNLKGYNALMEERGEPESKLPEIVIIIDEFADLMIAAKNEVETAINRLAALARAAGMYLVIATQRPTVNVITGVIKANIPSRIAFNVTSYNDSRTILDMAGAEKLLGRGDMIYNPSGAINPQRIQGNFVSDREIEQVINFIKSQYEASYDEAVIETIQKEQERVAASLENHSASEDGNEEGLSRSGSDTKDELFLQAVEMVLENGQASVAMFQRKFKIGYQRAARLVDQMEERRIIGPYEGTKPRQVLISRQEFLEMMTNESD